jgi:hypothetical protein
VTADTTSMSQVSPRMRIVAAAGLGLVVLLAAFKFLVLSHHAQAQTPPVVVQHPAVVQHHSALVQKATTQTAKPTRRAAKRVHHAKPAAPKLHLDPALPAPLRRALMHSRVVVAVLYASDAPGDTEAVSEARKGAHAAHVGFAMLNVRNETIARGIAAQVDGASDPAVLFFRRPGTVALKLDGFVDAAVVAQAAANTHP